MAINKLVKTSFVYLIVGLLFGVYSREFPKFFSFQGTSQLGVLHTHTLVLGMFFFLVVLLLEKNFQLSQQQYYRKFYLIYNVGLSFVLLMMFLRGTLTVLGYSQGMPAIAGIAGLSHILLALGFFLFFIVLIKQIKKQ